MDKTTHYIEEIYKIATNNFKKLQKNKKPLTDEERALVRKRKALWSNGNSAVWKSVDPKTGKTTYVTHTHRAYNTAPTLKGAISRFHNFIKSTASEKIVEIEKIATKEEYGKCQVCGKLRRWKDESKGCSCGHDHLVSLDEKILKEAGEKSEYYAKKLEQLKNRKDPEGKEEFKDVFFRVFGSYLPEKKSYTLADVIMEKLAATKNKKNKDPFKYTKILATAKALDIPGNLAADTIAESLDIVRQNTGNKSIKKMVTNMPDTIKALKSDIAKSRYKDMLRKQRQSKIPLSLTYGALAAIPVFTGEYFKYKKDKQQDKKAHYVEEIMEKVATNKENSVNKDGKIPSIEKALKCPIAKEVATMMATSHEYKVPNVDGALAMVKNYKWEKSTEKLSNMQGINKPIKKEKVMNIAENIKKNKGKVKPFIVVNQLHGIRPQTPGKKILLDGHHRYEACEFLGKNEVPIYKGTYTGKAQLPKKELREMDKKAIWVDKIIKKSNKQH